MCKRSRKIVEVPDELVAEILLLLPVKSLLRFKSVCKYWNGLIEKPEFVSKHHQRGQKYFLTLTGDDRLSQRTLSPFTSPKVVATTRDEVVDLTHQLPPRNPVSILLRPCNGIVFLKFIDTQYLHLWNPATRELKALPEPNVRFPSSKVVDVWYGVTGFGFDSEVNDYKVVIIHYAAIPSLDCFLSAHIYSLSSGSWSEIDPPGHVLQSQFFRLLTPNWHLHIDGMHFWLWQNDDDFVILSFDFTSETFTTTLLPPDMSTRNLFHRWSWRLPDYFFILNGCIAFLNPLSPERYCDHGLPMRDYEIRVLNEIGNTESWTKLYKFEACSYMNLPLGNLKEDELFVKSESGELVWCAHPDPTCKYHTDNRYSVARAYPYKESLMKLKRTQYRVDWIRKRRKELENKKTYQN